MIKVSIFFEGNERECGWTETLYANSSTISGVTSQIATYITKRLAVAPSSVKIVAWRANVIGSRSVSRLITLTTSNTGTFNSETDMTEPWTALLVQLASADQVRVSRFLHGIPQSQVTGGTYTPTSGFSTALTSLEGELTSVWKIWAKDPTNPSAGKISWAISSALPIRLTEHKVGRPFGLPVGRRVAVA